MAEKSNWEGFISKLREEIEGGRRQYKFHRSWQLKTSVKKWITLLCNNKNKIKQTNNKNKSGNSDLKHDALPKFISQPVESKIISYLYLLPNMEQTENLWISSLIMDFRETTSKICQPLEMGIIPHLSSDTWYPLLLEELGRGMKGLRWRLWVWLLRYSTL